MNKLKLTKKALAAVISVAVAAAVITALLIVNIFYPLKYLSAYFVRRTRPQQGQLVLRMLDVGQADCALATLPDGKVMLIDGGGGSYTSTLSVIRALNSIDCDFIDYVVCTSVKAEHCGGLAEIIGMFGAGTIFYPYCVNKHITSAFSDFVSAAEGSGAQLVISEYGAGAESGDFYFTFLAPDVHTASGGAYDELNSSPSDQSIDASSAVLWMEYAGAGIFYAGDSPTSSLEKIADDYALLCGTEYFCYNGHYIDFSRCALYKAAGHGGEGYHSSRLMSALSPKVSLVSVGENNSEGCPSLAAMSDMYACGEVYATMFRGTVTATVTSEGSLSVRADREG